MLSAYAQQTMIHTLPVAACVFTGPDLVISAANSQFLMIWDRNDDLIGQKLREALPETAALTLADMLISVYRTGSDQHRPEVPFARADDQHELPRYFDLSFKPLRDQESRIYGVVNTAVDVTEKVKAFVKLEGAVEELAAMNEELEATNEELRATNDNLFQAREELQYSLGRLAKAEERARLAAEAVNLGIFDLDLSSGKVVSSEKMAGIFGFTIDTPHGDYLARIHPDDRPLREQAHHQAIITGHLLYEARILRPDSSTGWIRAEGKVYYSREGTPLRMLGTVIDITGQKQARDIQQKLKSLADHSGDLMSLLELDGVNSYINEAGKKLLGFESDDEVRRTPISALHRPEDFEQVSREVLPGVMSQGRWTGTMQVRHFRTGEVFPVLNYTIRIDDPDTGKPIGIGAIMRDLRPELAAKKALADSEQLLRQVTSAAPAALWLADSDGRMHYVNETWTEWTGKPADALLGEGWLAVIAAEDRPPVTENFRSAFADRGIFEVECRMVDAAGQLRWCQATGHPLLDSAGEFTGYVGAFIDLTAQKDLQQHKDDFISIASHELKTPITSLNAALQLMERVKDKPGDPMLGKLLQQARKSAERVRTLVDDLLNVGRLQQKELHLDRSTFILSQLLNACANPVSLASKKKINISGELELEIRADESRIDQVITNLLTNAVKYAPAAAHIDIGIYRVSGFVKVSVTDYGPGIAPAKMTQLFKRYYRVEDTRSSVSGLGLGLYISREIIERHGGNMGVDSIPGTGSTFWFTLPVEEAVAVS